MRRAFLPAVASLLVGCAGPDQAVVSADAPIHLGDEWFSFAAEQLGISAEEVRRRDQALSEDEPPEDEQLPSFARAEAAAIWLRICAGCHGERGDLEGATELPGNKPRKWGSFGVSMGFFFGGDDMRAGIYRKIRDGVQTEAGEPTLMRGFASELSRMQLWALVRHIEGF